MAAVRGAGFSSAVLEDIYFDRLRENLDQAEELGVDFVELPVSANDRLTWGSRAISSSLWRRASVRKSTALLSRSR